MEWILDRISKYRTILMGIAMLWVVFHHCNCLTHYNINKIIAFPCLNMGYLGVDMFLFLSGFGIYCSLTKNSDVLDFLIRRIKRFIPAILIFIIYIICKPILSIKTILSFILFNNFWLTDTFGAFLSLIFFFYLLSPMLKNIIENHLTTGKKQLLFLFVIYLISFCYIGHSYLYAFSRLPIYIIGLYAGYNYCNHKRNDKVVPWLILSSLLGFILLVITFLKFVDVRVYYGLIWYPSALFIPGLIYLFIIILEKLVNLKITNEFIKVLNIIGKYSLTIYVVDAFITNYLQIHFFFIHLVASLLIGCLYGYIWQFFTDKCINTFIKYRGH